MEGLLGAGGFWARLILFCQVQVRAFNRLYYLSAKIVQSVKGPHLYLTRLFIDSGIKPSFIMSRSTTVIRTR